MIKSIRKYFRCTIRTVVFFATVWSVSDKMMAARPNSESGISGVIQTGHALPITAIALSSDGKWLASASADGTVKLWVASTGELIRTIVVSQYWVECLAFSPQDDLIATGSGDHLVRVWNT